MKRWFVPQTLYSFTHLLPDGRKIVFDAFWPGFKPAVDYAFWVDLLPRFSNQGTIRVLGPFWRPNNRPELERQREANGLWDYFITGESRENPIDLARKSIGFRLPKTGGEFRFPYWQWYLTWPGYETHPLYHRFGKRLSIDALMAPMQDLHPAFSPVEYESVSPKAVLITSHLKRHRRKLWKLTDKAMGCDAYGRKIRPTDLPKTELLKPYPFNLCPENRLAEGYITEKMPEAFLCGAVPITYCHPDDLARDFNPRAVVNLYGLSRRAAMSRLRSLATNHDQYQTLRSEPLLLQRPNLDTLKDFLAS